LGGGGLHQNGNFSVKSMYLALISDNRVRLNSTIWKLKVPLKIKIFLWYLERGVIFTKDNLIQRNWWAGKHCVFLLNLNLFSIFLLSLYQIHLDNSTNIVQHSNAFISFASF
jgi:hypothetical protein